MNKFLLLLLISFSLYASNPKTYAMLGDTLYNSVEGIDKLLAIEMFHTQEEKIFNYIEEVENLKKAGFKIDTHSPDAMDKKEYLKALRKLSKDHDYFVRLIRSSFKRALTNGDIVTVSELMKTGLLNTEKVTAMLNEYYELHCNDQNLSVIEPYVTVNRSKNMNISRKTRKELSKLERIRQRELQEERERQRRINEETRKAKEELNEKQKKELGL